MKIKSYSVGITTPNEGTGLIRSANMGWKINIFTLLWVFIKYYYKFKNSKNDHFSFQIDKEDC